jgi:hypothetical protein
LEALAISFVRVFGQLVACSVVVSEFAGFVFVVGVESVGFEFAVDNSIEKIADSKRMLCIDCNRIDFETQKFALHG